MGGSNGHRGPEITDPDLQWWVRFGSRIEARQHMGPDLRQKLVEHIDAAAGGADLFPEWASRHVWNSGRSRRSMAAEPWFDPSVRLGLYDKAWELQQVLASGSPAVPDLPLEVDHPNCAEYAWWVLGEMPHQPPEYVSSTHRAAAFLILGKCAPADPKIQAWLLERANNRAASGGHDSKSRRLAMEALQWAAAEDGDDPRALTCLLEAARDSADPLRGCAIASLRAAAIAGRDEAMKLLVGVANDRSDSLRDDAVHALRWVVWLGQRPALNIFLEVALYHASTGKPRFNAVELIGWAAGEGRLGALELLCGITRQRSAGRPPAAGPVRAAAISALSWSAGVEQPEVVSLLCHIAQDKNDPERPAAIRALAWAASRHVAQAEATLTAIAEDSLDQMQADAIAALKKYDKATR